MINPSHPDCLVDFACESCAAGDYLRDTYPTLNVDDDENALEEVVAYKIWAKSEAGRHLRTTVTTGKNAAITEFLRALPCFIRHHQVKGFQHEAYRMAKSLATSSHILLQVDFAENFSCFFQDEIQAAHWGHPQVTLFTCCMWNGGGIINYAVCSDLMDHNKETAVAFLIAILKDFLVDTGTEVSQMIRVGLLRVVFK